MTKHNFEVATVNNHVGRPRSGGGTLSDIATYIAVWVRGEDHRCYLVGYYRRQIVVDDKPVARSPEYLGLQPPKIDCIVDLYRLMPDDEYGDEWGDPQNH